MVDAPTLKFGDRGTDRAGSIPAPGNIPITVGIVGHEAAKFTARTEAEARRLIRRIIDMRDEGGARRFGRVVSGACPLGGIDAWAIEEARLLGVADQEFPPAVDNWDHGFKPRNMQIAEASIVVYSLVVATLPDTYTGRRFALCYHCGTNEHVKSGGCWTVKYAKSIGRRGHVIVIR